MVIEISPGCAMKLPERIGVPISAHLRLAKSTGITERTPAVHGPAEYEQVIGDDAKSHPPQYAALAAVPTAAQAIAALERADPSLHQRSPYSEPPGSGKLSHSGVAHPEPGRVAHAEPSRGGQGEQPKEGALHSAA